MRIKIPDGGAQFVRRNPQVLVAATVVLIAFDLYNLIQAIGLYHRATQIVAELQREASEQLGG